VQLYLRSPIRLLGVVLSKTEGQLYLLPLPSLHPGEYLERPLKQVKPYGSSFAAVSQQGLGYSPVNSNSCVYLNRIWFITSVALL